MAEVYEWIVVGGGLTGAALAYQLTRSGSKRVLLLETHAFPQGATRYSYGGIPYWSGTTPLTKQLCQEGIAIHRQLSEELGADTEFRDCILLLTISPIDDPVTIASLYADCGVQPLLLGVESACELEPQLNPKGIAGAIKFNHAHVNPLALLSAYLKAFQRLGGVCIYQEVQKLRIERQTVESVVVADGTEYFAYGVVICAGGWTRSLLKQHNINCRVYFTHAELIEIPPTGHELRCMIMPADTKRYQLEATAADPISSVSWEEMETDAFPPSIDAGAVQFRDGTIRIGQLSRILSDPYASVDQEKSEKDIRKAVSRILPTIGQLKGTWHRCLVAFTADGLPLVGKLKYPNLYVFSGFTSPMVYVPTLARRFADYLHGARDKIIEQLRPER
ncbi:MAG: NAD(P)/FAD-dependent oxidoreductase [Pseudanabaenaceae cyanobacterium]